MPVFWFALCFVPQVNWYKSVFIFLLLHILLYPASNGYNSYMDKDNASIGGIKHPMQPTRQLFIISVAMDVVGSLLALLISLPFFAAYVCYILFSRLYSYRGIRLKKYPIIGYITVIINQGMVTFFMVYNGCSQVVDAAIPWQPLVAAAFLIGGFYPISQIYQHKQDAEDGVTTISMLLGIRGTFIFCAAMYCVVFALLFSYFYSKNNLLPFYMLQIFFLPIIVYFVHWFWHVWRNDYLADFKHTMQLNWLASTCTNLAFITLLILNQF
ncbi:MAG: UbiA prenyltransferase family protein [Deinococcales bacterium]|nr:UbiA prenyltransferase family protein [Chitinophagaceae bacterium]